MAGEYLPRIVDKELEKGLSLMGAVHIEGPKWCGKTRTAMQRCNSSFEIVGSRRRALVETAIETDSTAFLAGDTPRLIDEWQEVPEVWDVVRFEVDHRGAPGQFVLTGSSVPPIGSTLHSGAGRISSLRMRTMSLFESGESDGSASLEGLFEGGRTDCLASMNLDGLVHAIVRGGWPEAVVREPFEDAGFYAREYLGAVCSRDMSSFLYKSVLSDAGAEGDGADEYDEGVAVVADRLMAAIARNLSTSASVTSIYRDVSSQRVSVSENTLRRYVAAMERMFILENLDAWNPHVRSRTRLSRARKWHFSDPSMACAALGVGEARLMEDVNALGFFFESLCLRDLRVYAEGMDGSVYYLRNNNGYEVDFIVELRDGRWGAFEAKLGTSEYDKAAANLLKLREFVDTDRCGEPSFLAILTGAPMGYTRGDGVRVVPLGCLGP